MYSLSGDTVPFLEYRVTNSISPTSIQGMCMPSVGHQQSYFNHPVVENYVKAKGKFNIFSYTNPASLSAGKLFHWSARACTRGMRCFFNGDISEPVGTPPSLGKALTTWKHILLLQPWAADEVFLVSNGLNLVAFSQINETSNILRNKNSLTTHLHQQRVCFF